MKVETKFIIDNDETILIAESYPIKIYQVIENTHQFYITNLDEVIASITLENEDSIDIESEYKKHELLYD